MPAAAMLARTGERDKVMLKGELVATTPVPLYEALTVALAVLDVELLNQDEGTEPVQSPLPEVADGAPQDMVVLPPAPVSSSDTDKPVRSTCGRPTASCSRYAADSVLASCHTVSVRGSTPAKAAAGAARAVYDELALPSCVPPLHAVPPKNKLSEPLVPGTTSTNDAIVD